VLYVTVTAMADSVQLTLVKWISLPQPGNRQDTSWAAS